MISGEGEPFFFRYIAAGKLSMFMETAIIELGVIFLKDMKVPTCWGNTEGMGLVNWELI